MQMRHPTMEKIGLGVGMDLPWGAEIGFINDPEIGDTITPKTKEFFKNYANIFNYVFFAFQPKNYNHYRAKEYFPAYDNLFKEIPKIKYRAFHHTLLNMGTLDTYNKEAIAEFTNELIKRYDFKWIVEDLGIWTIHGKSLPYPLPPFLTERGLAACIKNISEWQQHLKAPLSVEFPGFSEGTNFFIGDFDAFDYFRIIAQKTNCAVTIDIGHILSYQWLQNRIGEKMFDELDKLPLDNCFEFHLSGCIIQKGKFLDLHHGILLDEQINLLLYLIPRCDNLRAITYEDPKYSKEGILVPKSHKNFLRLKDLANSWRGGFLNV